MCAEGPTNAYTVLVPVLRGPLDGVDEMDNVITI